VRKLTRLLCALFACGPLALGVRAAELSGQGAGSAATAKGGHAADGNAPGEQKGLKTARPGTQESTHADPVNDAASKGAASKGGNAAAALPLHRTAAAHSGAAHTDRGNAERLHSVQRNARALGSPARQSSRGGRGGSTRAVSLDSHNSGGPRGASPANQPRLTASNMPARATARLMSSPRMSSPRNSGVGGPHAQGIGQVGGPAVGRVTHSATIDGTQLHRKF
jgi:hypothetical protein